MMKHPQTDAGQTLFDHLLEVHKAGYIGGTTWERIERGILAIEDESTEFEALRIWGALRAMGPRPIRLSVIQAVVLSGAADASPAWPRRVLLHEGVLEQFGRVAWGEPDADGFYTPSLQTGEKVAP